MLARPLATVNASPSFGRSAVMQKLWNRFCNMKNGMPHNTIRP